MKEYKKSSTVRWADLDPNRHLRPTAYNDYATHVRFSFLEENGFGAKQFLKFNFGPVIVREETRYFREVGMNEEITINFKMSGMSEKAERFHMTHEVYKQNGKLAATVTLEGGWLDLATRKLMAPPRELAELLFKLPKADDFVEIAMTS